jgi:hypothetical protein
VSSLAPESQGHPPSQQDVDVSGMTARGSDITRDYSSPTAPTPNVRRRTVLPLLVTMLVALAAFWPSFESGAGLMDEGMILVYPEMVANGKVPYRDFETFYGPANPALLAGVFSAFGTNVFVERTVGVIYRMLILLAIYAIVQRWNRMLALGCVFLATCLLLGTHLPAYAWFGAMMCGLWSLWLAGSADSRASCYFSGILAGGALLFRVDVGPAVVLSALPLLYGMRWPARWHYALGGACALLPLALLTWHAGLQQVLNNLFLTPVIHSSPARHLPISSAEPYLINLLIAHIVAAGVNVVAGIVAMRSDSRATAPRLLLAVGLFGLGLTHQAAQRLDLVHMLFAAFASLSILPLSLLVLGARFRPAARKSEVLLAVVAVIAAVQAIAPELTTVVRTAFSAALRADGGATFVERHGRSFPFNSPQFATTVDQLLGTLDNLAAPGERLFVGPADLRRTNYNDTYIYHLMPKLRPATYFLEMNPISANASGSRLADDIATADWLVLNRTWDSWNEPNRSKEFGSDRPNEVVRGKFELKGEFGPYLLLRRKAPADRAS